MGILGIIAILLEFGLFFYFLVYFSIALKKRQEGKQNLERETFYEINPKGNLESLTKEEKKIIDFLTIKSSNLYNIKKYCEVSNYEIKKMKKEGLIREVQKEQRRIPVGKFIALILATIAIFILANYYWLIQLNLRNFGLIFYLFLIVTIIFLFSDRFISNKKTKRILAISLSGSFFLLLILYTVFGGRTYFHAKQYSELLSVSQDNFSSEIKTVDINTLPMVDKAYGEKLGNVKLGEYPAIGSEYELGEFSDIIYQGKQYLVAPLEYRGFFKWLKNKDAGTPGYILVDKVTAKTDLVILSENQDNGMRYTPSAFFENNLTRHAYYHGLSQYRLEQVYFEIDEEGIPYYIMQYSLPTIFINGGWDIAKIGVVRATDGEVSIYDPDLVPEWVESVYPEFLCIEHLNYYGSLQNGWFNSFLAQKGVLMASLGTKTVTVDGRLHYFTGMTSAGNDESTVGFVYIDTKTKDTKLFLFPGATEEAAMNKTITLIPQPNISASFPIPISVEGIPTYFLLIKGQDGRILRHVFLSVENLEVYGMSETNDEAYNAYLRNLGISGQTELSEISGTIDSINSYVVEGNTMYWIEIQNQYYLLNVQNFSTEDMGYFISKKPGDSLKIKVKNKVIVEIVKE